MAAPFRQAPERFTLENVEEAFSYKSWTPEQVAAGKEVTAALIQAAKKILLYIPESPLRTRALNMLFDARMVANAAITHEGRF